MEVGRLLVVGEGRRALAEVERLVVHPAALEEEPGELVVVVRRGLAGLDDLPQPRLGVVEVVGVHRLRRRAVAGPTRRRASAGGGARRGRGSRPSGRGRRGPGVELRGPLGARSVRRAAAAEASSISAKRSELPRRRGRARGRGRRAAPDRRRPLAAGAQERQRPGAVPRRWPTRAAAAQRISPAPAAAPGGQSAAKGICGTGSAGRPSRCPGRRRAGLLQRPVEPLPGAGQVAPLEAPEGLVAEHGAGGARSPRSGTRRPSRTT